MSGSNLNLTPNDIYLTAFAGASAPHYAICVMKDQINCIKFHATNLATSYFVFEVKQENLVDSLTLCVLLKIGTLRDKTVVQVQERLERIPMVLDDCDKAIEERFTCRVWLKQAVRVLVKEGIISCSNVVALVDDELRDEYALKNYERVITGSGGVELYDSRHSK